VIPVKIADISKMPETGRLLLRQGVYADAREHPGKVLNAFADIDRKLHISGHQPL
jgi:hypothetical protein